MTPEEFDRLCCEADEYTKACNDMLEARYRVRRCTQSDYNLRTGEAVFSDGGTLKLIARFQIAGTFSTCLQTWLWSWANPSIPEPVKRELLRVKKFGERHGIPELMDDHWHGASTHGWCMTNIAAMILQAQGAYRCTCDPERFLFVVITDLSPVA